MALFTTVRGLLPAHDVHVSRYPHLCLSPCSKHYVPRSQSCAEKLPVKKLKKSEKQVTAADLASTYLSYPGTLDKRRIHALWLREANHALCLRAWLSACIAERCIDKVAQLTKVATRCVPHLHLTCLSQLVINIELIENDKPTVVENEFTDISLKKHGVDLLNKRYKSRVHKSAQTTIEINGGAVKAQAIGAKGKTTSLQLFKGKLPSTITTVRVIGREEMNSAESAREAFVLSVLESAELLHASPFVRVLWLQESMKKFKKAVPESSCSRKQIDVATARTIREKFFAKLNPSHNKVASAMVADNEPLVIAHGPPGTGKTSTIAAALQYWEAVRQPDWVVAHSNVGVQNIAVSLLSRGISFRIIVSDDFYVEWHEHLYEDIERFLIRSDDFGTAFDVRNSIGETKIILCTLSMLSNGLLHSYGISQHVPVERLVVDEASQIDTFEFMHLFDEFKKVLQKVCMFGDPKQLPPFGAEFAPKIKTIFDFKQFQQSAYFLDTQYRMPVPLGKFISQSVYDSKLKSQHKIKDNRCVVLVDVCKGEEERVGSSWKNVKEVNTIVNIVTKHYQQKHFCVITPYDAQRAAITAALKAANVADYEHVYNVDSFQGHEAPIIIVSSVRTTGPGFLRSLNRMNVMLTRCKEGMVVVTQRAFLRGSGKKTLLGKLAQHWEDRAGEGSAWVDAMQIANGRARLPGSATAIGSSVPKRRV